MCMANLGELIDTGELSFDGIDSSFFLIGLLSAFDNRYQAKADSFFEEISWKQFFAIICINLCKESLYAIQSGKFSHRTAHQRKTDEKHAETGKYTSHRTPSGVPGEETQERAHTCKGRKNDRS